MSDLKISALTDGGNLRSGDQLAIARSGTSFRATLLGDGWIDDAGETWTFATSSTFTVAGDVTAKYTPGTRIKLTQTTVKYFVVAKSVFAAGTTTVTITGGSDYTLANAAISANFHSYAPSPQGYPDWFNFAPATTGITGAGGVARFRVVGRMVTIVLSINGTSNATTKAITLPITPANIAGDQWVGHLTVENNGISQTTPGEIVVNANNATASIFKDCAAAAWTGSGAWFAIGVAHYEI